MEVHSIVSLICRSGPEVFAACCERGGRIEGKWVEVEVEVCVCNVRHKTKVTHENTTEHSITLKGNCFNEIMCQVRFI